MKKTNTKFQVGDIVEYISDKPARIKIGDRFVVKQVREEDSGYNYRPELIWIDIGGPYTVNYSPKHFKLVKAKNENVQEEENVSRENVNKAYSVEKICVGGEIKPIEIKLTFNQQEEVKMSNVNKTPRRVVNIRIFDEDKGLPVENSLVYSLTDFVTEDSNEEAFREVLMNLDVASALIEHNKVRTSTVNQEVLERTGNEVYLREIKLKDLRVEITPA